MSLWLSNESLREYLMQTHSDAVLWPVANTQSLRTAAFMRRVVLVPLGTNATKNWAEGATVEVQGTLCLVQAIRTITKHPNCGFLEALVWTEK